MIYAYELTGLPDLPELLELDFGDAERHALTLHAERFSADLDEFRARFVGAWQNANWYARDLLRASDAPRSVWASPLSWENVDVILAADKGREIVPCPEIPGIVVFRRGVWVREAGRIVSHPCRGLSAHESRARSAPRRPSPETANAREGLTEGAGRGR